MSVFKNSIIVTLLSYDGVDDRGVSIGPPTEYILPAGLRVTGTTSSTSLGYPNQATLQLFNLDEITRRKFTNKSAKVRLSGGRLGQEITFFEGDIKNAVPTRQDLDVILTVYLGSNERSWSNATISKTYEGEVLLKTILTDLAKAFPNSKGNPSFDRAPKFEKRATKFSNVTLDGSVRDLLKQYTTSNTTNPDDDVTYTILDSGEVAFADSTGIFATESEVVIDKVGQIIGVPTVDTVFLELKTHFKPSASVFNTLNVSSEFATSQIGNLFFTDQTIALEVSGQKRIREVVHNFDTRGSDWNTTIKASTL